MRNSAKTTLHIGCADSADSRAVGIRGGFGEKRQDPCTRLFQSNAVLRENNARGTVALTNQAEQKMFCADISMIQIAGFFDREFNNALSPRRLWQFSNGDHIGPTPDG